MTRRRVLIATALMMSMLLCAVAAAPWVLYWKGLSEIEGRPTPATHAATTEQIDGMLKKLRLTQSVQIRPSSPYSYLLQGGANDPSARVAWVVARAYNVQHLSNRRFWHLSGAALTVWLTRNWTPSELITAAAQLNY
ncbi:hypothetical protein M2427_003111 [Bradyrhizobium sp. BR13661]|jgi:hypothetical protein|nr:hypothetical protein [Bradyrhizobium sp. BR13661]